MYGTASVYIRKVDFASHACSPFYSVLSVILRNATVVQSCGVKVKLPPFLLYESDILFGARPTKYVLLPLSEYLVSNSRIIRDCGFLGCDALYLGDLFPLKQRFHETSIRLENLDFH